MSQGDPQGWIGALVGAAGALIGAVTLLRRRLSRDNTEVVKDRAEADIVARLVIERDAAITEAQRVREQRTSDAQTIARLVAENEAQAREVIRLLASIRKMVRGLPPEVQKVLVTDFMPLGPPEER
jgi:seryl-tRNA synthetase